MREIVLWLKTTIHHLNLAVLNIERMHRKRRVIFGSSFISIVLSHTNKLIHFHWHTTYSVSAGPGVIVLFFINLAVLINKHIERVQLIVQVILPQARRRHRWNRSILEEHPALYPKRSLNQVSLSKILWFKMLLTNSRMFKLVENVLGAKTFPCLSCCWFFWEFEEGQLVVPSWPYFAAIDGTRWHY